MQVNYFSQTYMWNVNKNCEKQENVSGMWDSPLYLYMKILFGIDEAVIFNTGIVHFMSQQMWDNPL